MSARVKKEDFAVGGFMKKKIERPEDGSIIVEEEEKIAIFPFFGIFNSKKLPGIRNTAVILSHGEAKNLLWALKKWDREN
ncbi:MAG: hypothetical protein KAI71_02800 [Candidatus Pacebacteria bacterium]|nr:hypothetical protein [Candidatus Paceibacterota bacterium]